MSKNIKILLVVGARPNFMKIAPIIRAIKKYDNIKYKLVHTGQHYDDNMSNIFFEELELPQPDCNFDVGSMSHANQTARIMTLFENYCLNESPDIVLVVGDVNSTLACAMVVSKLKNIKLAHIEAGLRSFDRGMPEEVNRIVTDVLSDYLFCTDYISADNLYENKDVVGKTYVVGDVMMDTLLYNIGRILPKNNIDPYILVTLHRPSNTDNIKNLENILKAIDYVSKDIKVRFPIHPRTISKIKTFGFYKYLKRVKVLNPLGYMDFLHNMKYASMVLTDSGGIQVETTVLDIPCLTIRQNTEHVFTLIEGTNRLVDTNTEKIINGVFTMVGDPLRAKLSEKNKRLLDGKASDRIVKILEGIK